MYLSDVKIEVPTAAPGTRDENASGGAGNVRPFGKPVASPCQVIERDDPAPELWQPPKEVIWMGQPHRVLALSKILAARLSQTATKHIET